MKLLVYLTLACAVLSYSACQDRTDRPKEPATSDSLTADQTHLATNALKGLTVAEGLEVKLVAAEPMLRNPTDIDVDERGRIWVTEAYNYRPDINGNPTNPNGDRIVILEDTNGDGSADTSKVFYQGPEINAPLGICVLGNKVIVSQSPYIWAFYDDNNDDKADRKEVLFKGIGGEQHDHGAHAFTAGPDGKLYFNMGNEAKTIKDKNGKGIKDDEGDEIKFPKYVQGMVFRCDPDGSHLECLADNFRNNYEVAVDSYGTMWQSDNDDDGNRGVRINYVMQHGNYGYVDEMTNASWEASRTNMEDSIPFRHWHLNDPGVVPNLLQTGAGSPTGMVVYEGTLLPQVFRGQMIHCDAGVNVVRSYPVSRDGAGYKASIVDILKNEKDQWFRPADVCVAPDGSLFVADWYDPGVGGHQAGDQLKGRIYRIAPPSSKYEVPRYDYTSSLDAIKALQNPNLSVRYHAFQSLKKMGDSAIAELEKLWKSEADSRMRARAFWILTQLPGQSDSAIRQAIRDAVPDIRIAGIRAAVNSKRGIISVVSALVNDPEPQVRRECALALRHVKDSAAANLWAALAAKHDGRDRWYLEALGIGADHQWDKFFQAFVEKVKDPMSSPGYRDIVWRARTDAALPYLARLATEPSELYTRLRYFRAFDFHPGAAKGKYLLKMLTDTSQNKPEFQHLLIGLLDRKTVESSPAARTALKNVLDSSNGEAYLGLVKRYELKTQKEKLLLLSIDSSATSVGQQAAELLLIYGGKDLARATINGTDTGKALKLLQSLSRVGIPTALTMIENVAFSSKFDGSIRTRAAFLLGKSDAGEKEVLRLLDSKSVPVELKQSMAQGVANAWKGNVRKKAAQYLGTEKQSNKKQPVLADLVHLKADPLHGKQIFAANCGVCHQVGNEGIDFGPKLTEIGKKLPKEGLLDAILHPSAGISFGYEGWDLRLEDGTTVSGIISSKTAKETEIKFPGGTRKTIQNADIVSKKELKESMMTEGLQEQLSNQDLADLLEYLQRLK